MAPLGALVWNTFDVNLMWVMSFHPQKVEYFCFYTVYMDPIVKISDFEVIFTSQNVFLLPEGLLCGIRLKSDVHRFVCMFVRCPDFSGKSSLTYSERDINFGFIYLGKISRSEKSEKTKRV